MPVSINQNPDIMFIVSPANAQSAYMPFYFLYLAGYLEKYGYSVEIINPHEKTTAENIKIIMKEVKAKKPRFVGLSSFVTDYNIILGLATQIRECSDAKIMVGNAHPSIAPEDFIFNGSPFDIVVRGEGELTVKQILTDFGNGSDIANIKGIAYLKDGRMEITKNRELMDLSECATPAYHKLDMQWYLKPTKYIIRRLATVGAVIYTGRGCPFKCSFCASNSVWQANDATSTSSLVRKRPLTQVIEELNILQNEYGFDFFYILDDTFGITEKDILDFCNAYRESGLKMLWAAETRANCIKNENIVRLLKESGCIQLDFGVESGSPGILKTIHKHCTVEQVVMAFNLCLNQGIRTFANILLNLPGEDEQDLKLTQGLLSQIKPTYTSIGVTQPYPGTGIYKNLGKSVPKEDYSKFDRMLPPEEFRLSRHQLNLKSLLLQWFLQYGVVTMFEKSLFKADRSYWTLIFKSKNRWIYLVYLTKELLLGPYWYFKVLKRFKVSQ